MFYYLDVQLYHLWDKSRFVCAHIGQNQHIYPSSIFHLYFDSRHPPLFRRLTRRAAIEKNFFIFFWIHYQLVLIILWFWFLFFWFSLVISHKSGLKLFFFIFSESFNSIQVPRYFSWVSFFWFIQYNKLSFRLAYKFHSIFTRFDFRYIFLVYISTCSALSILCFNSSTL